MCLQTFVWFFCCYMPARLFRNFTFNYRKKAKINYILRICLDSAVLLRNECCHAITFPRFNSPQQMVNINYFFLPIFHLPFSFNTISFYLGWYLSAQQGLSDIYHAVHGRIGNRVFHRSSNNGKLCNFERFLQGQYTLAEKCFFQKRNVYPSNV